MIDYLTHPTFSTYNEAFTPSNQSSNILTGGGLSTKTARVIEALQTVYPTVKTITHPKDIVSDVVLIEPLLFTMRACDYTIEEMIDELEASKAYKILYCSEKSILRMNHIIRNRIVKICHVITINCEFQRKVFQYVQIEKPLYRLCDPIPEIFCKPDESEKQMGILSTGHIAWFKNTEEVIKIFKSLKGVLPRTYIGSNNLWSNMEITDHSKQLQEELYEHCDMVFSEVARKQLAQEMKKTWLGLWIGYHDTFAFSLQEMMRCGVIIIGANHGLAPEVPIHVGSSTKEKIELIKGFTKDPVKKLDSISNEVANWAFRNSSYETFLRQLQKILARSCHRNKG